MDTNKTTSAEAVDSTALFDAIRPTQETNFCRVFELPDEYPSGFCFGGGRPVQMKMVDWFNPWPPPKGEYFGLADMTWTEVCAMLLPFLRGKNYVQPGKQYLVLTDFGGSLVFSASNRQ